MIPLCLTISGIPPLSEVITAQLFDKASIVLMDKDHPI